MRDLTTTCLQPCFTTGLPIAAQVVLPTSATASLPEPGGKQPAGSVTPTKAVVRSYCELPHHLVLTMFNGSSKQLLISVQTSSCSSQTVMVALA